MVLPADVLAAPTAAASRRRMPVPAFAAAPTACRSRRSELIRAAQRPALLVGIRGADPDSCQALRALVAATGLPVVETFQAAGVISRALEDNFLGRVGLFRNQPGDVVIDHADVLIAVGYDAVEYDPVLWNHHLERTIVHIDSLPAEIDNNYQPTVELLGNVGATLTALTDSLAGLALAGDVPGRDRRTAKCIGRHRRCRMISTGRHRAQPGRCRPAAARRTRRLGHHRLRRRLGLHLHGPPLQGLRAQTVVVFQRPTNPGRRAALGHGRLPGAAGHTRVSVSGDGGFLFSAQELETATRLGLTFTHIIFRDNSYDMVAFQEVLKYGRKSGVQLADYDIVSYAAAFGARGYRVKTLNEFGDTLRQALAEDGPSLIDVPVDYSRNIELAAHLHDDCFE